MFDLGEVCDLESLSEDNLITEFDCGNDDLNDFFCNDALNYQKELLGQTSEQKSKKGYSISKADEILSCNFNWSIGCRI